MHGFSLRWLLGSWALAHAGFSSCGARARLLRSMWDLPGSDIEPVSPALAFYHWATQGSPQFTFLFIISPVSFKLCCHCIVDQSCLTLCNPMDYSAPGFPVLHYSPEFAQTHVHWVSDTIQPSHSLSPPSPPALNLFQHQGLFQWVGSWHQVAKVLELQEVHPPAESKPFLTDCLKRNYNWAAQMKLFF